MKKHITIFAIAMFLMAGLNAQSMDYSERSSDSSMEELAALVETAGGEVIVTLIQNRPSPDPRSFIGDGKVAEMKALIALNDCDLAVFDNDQSFGSFRPYPGYLCAACQNA